MNYSSDALYHLFLIVNRIFYQKFPISFALIFYHLNMGFSALFYIVLQSFLQAHLASFHLLWDYRRLRVRYIPKHLTVSRGKTNSNSCSNLISHKSNLRVFRIYIACKSWRKLLWAPPPWRPQTREAGGRKTHAHFFLPTRTRVINGSEKVDSNANRIHWR